MPAVPKPRARKKRHTWLRKMGNQAHKWETFKHCVVYPFLWTMAKRTAALYIDAWQPMVMDIKCQNCENKLYLHLFDRPDGTGKWWRLEGGEIHHAERRSEDASKVFNLSNCSALCHTCHDRKHQP